MNSTSLNDMFGISSGVIGHKAWELIAEGFDGGPEGLAEWIREEHAEEVPPYLPDLVRLEHAYRTVPEYAAEAPADSYALNPTLIAIDVSYRGLPEFFSNGGPVKTPEEGSELVLIWRPAASGEPVIKAASPADLLAMKMAMEDISPDEVSLETDTPFISVSGLLENATESGLVIRPEPLIRRPQGFSPGADDEMTDYLAAEAFTLQWHITNACNLNCAHCYDRTRREQMPLKSAYRVLEELGDFCDRKRVAGQVTFIGGHPLLYPRFSSLYSRAVDMGFKVSIAGNPDSRKSIEELCGISTPSFYQVSLEGLEPHNDSIRGEGHFERTLDFLEVLNDLGVYSMVMLTLTSQNVEQVIALAEVLRGRADAFNFNRLSQVGQGSALALPDRLVFRRFLEDYLTAREENPVMGLKENLLNVLLYESGRECFGGCTGYGCGAAFNFVSLLPDGEVHACRKFPSLIGNILDSPLAEIYDSARAEAYRMGPKECRNCRIRPVCGGCKAVVHGTGGDIETRRDRYCFMKDVPHTA